MAIVSRDSPLAEMTLRKYGTPERLARRDLVKRICLSIGLLQPGDSRDVIVDIFEVIVTSNKPLTSKEIEERVIKQRKARNLSLQGIASSNIRRQIKRLKDIYLVESVLNTYRITENERLRDIFDEKICKFFLESIVWRVREHFVALDAKLNRRK